ncbi:MAG: hypothetical protein KatS3mg002_1384 [Candidatus Woesearchaeota archaeon]|nr:MAG: hypothetical protein KatS3mg002_1384 [Candidatus Woesearchaeota archaeon]
MGEDKNINGWNEWGKYVLRALEKADVDRMETKKEITEIRQQLQKLEIHFAKDISSLKTRSAIWGAITGFIATAMLTIISLFIKK